jgi:hypothetical protein
VLKEKKTAEKEYESAIEQGQTAVLMRQSKETLDTFTVCILSFKIRKFLFVLF